MLEMAYKAVEDLWGAGEAFEWCGLEVGAKTGSWGKARRIPPHHTHTHLIWLANNKTLRSSHRRLCRAAERLHLHQLPDGHDQLVRGADMPTKGPGVGGGHGGQGS